LVIDGGAQRIALVTVDQNKFPVEQTNPVRQAVEDATGIPFANVMVTASHTHRAPIYSYYPDSLVTPCVQAVQLAIADLAAVSMMTGTGTAPGLGENRRVIKGNTTWGVWQLPIPEQLSFPKEGPEDNDFVVLGVIDDQSGLYKAIVYDFPCAAANSEDQTLVSADFPGDTENYVRAQLGYDVPCLYLTGISGDTNPVSRNLLTPKPKLEFGNTLGAEIIRVLAEAVEPVTNPVAMVETWELQIPLRENPFFASDDIMLKWPGQYDTFQRNYDAQVAAEQPTYQCFVSGIKLGDNFAISMNPADLFLQHRVNIKALSPFKYTMTVEHTNGDHGYVATPLAFAGQGYETWYGLGNYLHTTAGQVIEDDCLTILSNLARSGQAPLNFPSTPTLGQAYIAAGVIWRWDGVKWNSTPQNVPYLPLSGGPVSGPIILPGIATQPLAAVPLQQLPPMALPLYQAFSVMGNGADITEDVMQSYNVVGGRLRTIGDRLIFRMGGHILGNPDVKRLSVRWGGNTIGNVTYSGGSMQAWRVIGEIMLTSLSTQVVSLQFSSFIGAGQAGFANSNRPNQVDTVLDVTGQNETHPVPNSITCEYFTIDYVAAGYDYVMAA
jgi:hypothetical protein